MNTKTLVDDLRTALIRFRLSGLRGDPEVWIDSNDGIHQIDSVEARDGGLYVVTAKSEPVSVDEAVQRG